MHDGTLLPINPHMLASRVLHQVQVQQRCLMSQGVLYMRALALALPAVMQAAVSQESPVVLLLMYGAI